MKIGIIGVGEMGGTLIRHYTKVGHIVKIANARGYEKLKNIADETGASPVSITEVVKA